MPFPLALYHEFPLYQFGLASSAFGGMHHERLEEVHPNCGLFRLQSVLLEE